MGSYFLRLIYQAQTVVRKRARRVFGPVNVMWQRVRLAIVGICAMKHTRGCGLKECVGEKPTFIMDVMFMVLEVFNDEVIPTSDGYWLHRCGDTEGGPACCDCIETLHRKMVMCIIRIILRARPPIPALSRWTKSGTTSDYYTLGFGICNVLL